MKFCGLTRPEDIAAVNRIRPDYAGFVFAPKSRRCVTPEAAAALRARLDPAIVAVGVFVHAAPEQVACLVREGVIEAVQLHGTEDEDYIARLRKLTSAPILRAFRIDAPVALNQARTSSADAVMLDAGAGDGRVFDWTWLEDFDRPYFLAGGLRPENVAEALARLQPWAVDVSSAIETDGFKDERKMAAFAAAVRNAQTKNDREKQA